MQRISLNMIVKNEEELLPRCLESVKGLFDEMVIVDTGSTDQTKEIAKNHGAKVVDFEWIQDFAAARNFAIEHSSKDWILWLDADEWFDEENAEKLFELKASLSDTYDGYLFQTYFLPNELPENQKLSGTRDNIKLFRRDNAYRWKYPIMEVIYPLNEKTDKLKSVPIYLNKFREETEERLIEQRKRYLKILLHHQNDYPDDIRFPFQIGIEYYFIREYPKAIPFLVQTIDRIIQSGNFSVDTFLSEDCEPKRVQDLIRKLLPARRIILQESLLRLAQSYLFTENLAKSNKLLENARRVFPKNCQMIHFQAGIHKYTGRVEKAKELFHLMVALGDSSTAEETIIIPRVARAVGKYNLAEIEQSEDLWLEALQDFPDNIAALKGLAEFYLKNNRLDDFNGIVARLEQLNDGAAIAKQLRAHE